MLLTQSAVLTSVAASEIPKPTVERGLASCPGMAGETISIPSSDSEDMSCDRELLSPP
jgi:hypothetical protein